MSIADKLTKLSTDITSAYNSVQTKGGTIPTNKNTENLASAITSIPSGGGGNGLAGIYIDTVGTTTYNAGDTFNLTGYVIKAVYGYGTETDVTSQCTFTPSGALATTDTGVTISFTDEVTRTTTQNITVASVQVINYTMLYDAGDECTDLTGGLTLTSSNAATGSVKNANNIFLNSQSYSSGGVKTNNSIDITDYKKFYTFGTTATVNCSWSDIGLYQMLDNISVGSNPNKSRTIPVSNTDYSLCLDLDTYTGAHILITQMWGVTLQFYVKEMFIVKQDNWQELCTKAGLTSSSYANENALCSNATAMTTILGSATAVNYMIYNCTGSFMAEFVSNSVSLNALNNSSYKTTIQANTHWNKFLNMVA